MINKIVCILIALFNKQDCVVFVGGFHEADWHDPGSRIPAKAEGLELTPDHNGTFNITWHPPQASKLSNPCPGPGFS